MSSLRDYLNFINKGGEEFMLTFRGLFLRCYLFQYNPEGMTLL